MRLLLPVVVGKDAVPRSTVGNLTRLMDEMVTALARCKQPKLKVGLGGPALQAACNQSTVSQQLCW
jgi:hypothetical protein